MKQDPIMQFAKTYIAMHKALHKAQPKVAKAPGPKKVVKKKRAKKASGKKSDAPSSPATLVNELLSEENSQIHSI
jgi:hypothetical protein